MNVVLDVVEALEEDGVRKVVLVNGHGGNIDTLRATLREHAGRHPAGEGAFVALTSTFTAIPDEVADQIDHPSDHGGESETSRMLHIRPDLVREEEFESFTVREPTVDHLQNDIVEFVPRWDAYLPESAGGETRESSAEKGEALVDGAADWIADFVVELDDADVHEDFPYRSDR